MKKFTLIFLCTLCLAVNTKAQTYTSAPIDSTLMSYYQRCYKNMSDTIVLSMADTLYRMAAEKHDQRMQAVALCTKLDHYYYDNKPQSVDSLVVWVNRVKKFAKETKQPRYYYFVWGSRLIAHYSGKKQYNIALLETDKMLKEAEAEDYKPGIIECYRSLSRVYASKFLTQESLTYLIKQIEVIEKYNLDQHGLSTLYSDIVSTYCAMNKPDEAFPYLKKAEKFISNKHEELQTKLAYVDYYIRKNAIESAANELKECREIFATDPWLEERHGSTVYSAEADFFIQTQNYERALQALNEWEASVQKKKQNAEIQRVTLHRADVYWEMGRKAEAAAEYKKVTEEMIADRTRNEEITTAEFATMLDLQRISTEKTELEQLSQKRKLQNTQTIVISLACLLMLILFFYGRQRNLNIKLKASHAELKLKNQSLQDHEEELRKAKELAEESSKFKTIFIQNMSHEIRTPLNSIVGFSAVLAHSFSEENEEVTQYATLIEDNSKLLLKLVNDVLDVSALDEDVLNEAKENVILEPVNVNQLCQQAMQLTKVLVKQGVDLVFTPACSELTITGNAHMMTQVLENLLSNAAKFTPKGKIELAYEVNKQNIKFTVTDTGIGIPPDKHEYIFERFVKLNEFTQGTGLGLPICEMVAKKLGGNLTLDKDYQPGTRFVFELPIVEQTPLN